MTYRIAAQEDIPALTRRRMEMRRERDASFDEKTLYPATLDFFRRNLENGSHVAFVCEEAGEIIGTVGLTLYEMPPTAKLKNGRVAKLMNMYTVPAWRGRGVARGMLEYAAAWARERGYFKLVLNSSPMGEPLYEHFGFRRIPNEYEIFLEG